MYRLARVLDRLTFTNIIQGVTCEGSKAPLRAFNNIVIALLLLVLFEARFFEVSRITVQSWAKRYAREKGVVRLMIGKRPASQDLGSL